MKQLKDFLRPTFVLAMVFALGFGTFTAYWALSHLRPKVPDTPAVVMQIRDVVRLETLQVLLYKKITFTPDPPAPGTLWEDVNNWVRYSLHAPKGMAIVFADAHLGVDLEAFGANHLAIQGRTAYVVLPPVKVSVELRPGETEVIGSNLDSKETAQLFELAKNAFLRETLADVQLNNRARESSERAVKALLLTLGFTEVHFVNTIESSPNS